MLFGVLGPIVIITLIIIFINILQEKKPQWLPEILTDWEFLPLWMHSFDPMDKVNTVVNLNNTFSNINVINIYIYINFED